MIIIKEFPEDTYSDRQRAEYLIGEAKRQNRKIFGIVGGIGIYIWPTSDIDDIFSKIKSEQNRRSALNY